MKRLTFRTGRWTRLVAALLGAATLIAGMPGSASAYDPVNVGSETQCRLVMPCYYRHSFPSV